MTRWLWALAYTAAGLVLWALSGRWAMAAVVGLASAHLAKGLRGGPTLAPTDLTLDHVVPHAQGGTDDPVNLRTSCLRHNQEKGARTFEQWMRGEPPVVFYPDREREVIPVETRLAVYRRDGFECVYCAMGIP